MQFMKKIILNIFLLIALSGCFFGTSIGVREVKIGYVEKNGNTYSGVLNSESMNQNLSFDFSGLEISRLKKNDYIVEIRMKNLNDQRIKVLRRLSPKMNRDYDTYEYIYLSPGETGFVYRGVALGAGVYWDVTNPSKENESQEVLIEIDGINEPVNRRRIAVVSFRGAGP